MTKKKVRPNPFKDYCMTRADYVAALDALRSAERAVADATLTASEAHAAGDTAVIDAAERRLAELRERRFRAESALEWATVKADEAWAESRNAA